MASLSGTHTKSTTVKYLKGCSIELHGSLKAGLHSSVSDMLDELGCPPLSQTRNLTDSVLQNY